MNLKTTIVLAASLAAVTQVDAHGGLIIPPCRNNHGNVNIFNFSKQPGSSWMSGGSCAGDSEYLSTPLSCLVLSCLFL
jgi:hypothetical protein